MQLISFLYPSAFKSDSMAKKKNNQKKKKSHLQLLTKTLASGVRQVTSPVWIVSGSHLLLNDQRLWTWTVSCLASELMPQTVQLLIVLSLKKKKNKTCGGIQNPFMP